MRKYQKAAVVVAMLGSVSFLGAGVSQAHGGDEPQVDIKSNQSQVCGNETNEGILNLDRVQANVIAIPVVSPQEFSHNGSCTNVFGIGK
jgi:hypothetical protein